MTRNQREGEDDMAEEEKKKIVTSQDLEAVKTQVMGGMINMLTMFATTYTDIIKDLAKENDELRNEIRALKTDVPQKNREQRRKEKKKP